jgi:ribosomal subunit interface protein
MNTTVTARHCEVTEDLRRRASELIERIGKLAHRPERAEVVFDDDHQRKIVEVIMHLPRGRTRVASAEATDFQGALDLAVEKLRHQLEKDAGRRVDRRKAKP